MTTPEPKAHQEFRREVAGWLERNRPAKPDFILPQSFMEVDTQQQFDYLRDWQRKVYEAGYLGMAWPKEYGGGGQPQIFAGHRHSGDDPRQRPVHGQRHRPVVGRPDHSAPGQRGP
ncbi:MAG TPA: acyl-CoA dehydrogenase family protein [Pseudomonadales bacterium]|nr:acyl-CoA dehydrogenase family protein [Pseudomonadales bacterium]